MVPLVDIMEQNWLVQDRSYISCYAATLNMTPYSPSMRLDYDFHRRMEIYYLYTRPLEIAREAGCPMPKLEMLEAELRFLEESGCKGTK